MALGSGCHDMGNDLSAHAKRAATMRINRSDLMMHLHRKLEDDQCFDYACMMESAWKIIFRSEDGARTETRLCEMHSDEFLSVLKRPWIIVRINA